ncbi:MAG: protein kinase, partial [Gemmatimonadales bacterium]|nr:protein kinase [Gemmatimonadales bacterium]
MAATLTCAHCGGGLGRGDRFCAQCGAELRSCATCGESLLPTDPSCPECGTPAPRRTPDDPATSQPGEWEAPWDEMVERLRRATLGEFEIGRELGRGGMAAVFLAHEISLDRKVAIKVMSPGLLMGEGMIERFRREAITIAQLHHPNIVSVYSVRQAEGLHFFIMRYVQGRSLEQVIQQARTLPLPMVRSIVYQVGSALTYAHRSRVIHRDIKPANILIDGDGNAVVTDFGIAKAAESPTQTITGALVGTPAYMSPEQCAGAEVSGASDQYALGAVAYEMLTGAPPFSGSTLTVMQAHVERPPLPLRERRADCPPELEAAILRMLAKDPVARWPRLPEAMAALGAAPLAEDDPLRAELGRLAAAAAGNAATSDALTPTSPTPLSRQSPGDQKPGRPVGGISILPPPAGLEIGDSFVLVAAVRGQRGTRLPPTSVTWTCDDPGILRFGKDGGVAVAIAAGSTVLTATCRGVRALLRVEVTAPRADEIVIRPLDRAIVVGDEVRLEAIVRDKQGQSISRAVAWQSADPSAATVSGNGDLVARAPGMTRVTAAADDARASLVIPILPAAPVAPRPREGSPAPGAPLPHARRRSRRRRRTGILIAALGAAVIGAALGFLREEDQPTTSVALRGEDDPTDPPTATDSGEAASLASQGPDSSVQPAALRPAPELPVRRRRAAAPPRVASISIAPRAPLVVGDTATLKALTLGAKGDTVRGGALAWHSSNVSVATIDPRTGEVQALSPGTALILAAAGGESALSELTVLPVPVADVSVHGARPLVAGEALRLRAVARDERGTELSGRDIVWSSDDSAVAAVDRASGVVAARSAGSAEVTATSEGRSGRVNLTVSAKRDTIRASAAAAESRRVEALLLAEAERCYDALRAKDVARLSEMYSPATASDRDMLKKLSRILQTEEWSAAVG